MTDNVVFPDGAQYGYVRFYNLPTSPYLLQNQTVRTGQQRLAEAYSGIPGRVAMTDNYAYVASVNSGLQIVDIEKAKTGTGETSIVGVFDSVAMGYSHPNDISVYRPDRAALTTNSGKFLSLDISNPTFPQVMSDTLPSGATALRVAVAPDYVYTKASGAPDTIDLAVISGNDGIIRTFDITDPYQPNQLGTVTKATGANYVSNIRDIVINKNSGLAFVATIDAITVIDIKNPSAPKLLNELKTIPGTTTAIGTTAALAERDGWLYMAGPNYGMRVMDFYTPASLAKDASVAIDSVNSVFLDKDEILLNALKVKYTISPTGYQAQSAKVVLLENGVPMKSIAGGTTGTNTASFPKGMKFQKSSKYEVYVIINCNTPDEKKSEKRVVKLADLSKIELRDHLNPCNRLPRKFKGPDFRIVLAADASQISKFNFWYDQSLLDHEYGQFILQLYRKSDNTLVKSGILGAEPIEVNEAGYFIVKLFLDENGNGVVDASEPKVREHTINSIKYDYSADVKSLKDGSFMSGMALTQLTQSFLELFINDNPATTMDIPVPSPQGKLLDTNDESVIERLSHFVGANFDITNECKATVPMYDYPITSIPSQKIAESDQLKSVIKQIITEDKSTILTNYLAFNSPQDPMPYSPNVEKSLDFKYKILLLPNDFDLWFGIGNSTIKGIKMYLTIENTGTVPVVTSARVTATVDDLYDFAIGAEFPAYIAARVQFGYGRNGEVGKSGKIYWNNFNIDSRIDFSLFPIRLN